jgi:GDPmannose 4,6-dehydratase
MKRALITGITGQDGSYLAELLLEKGYEVHGITRRASLPNTNRIEGILNRITLHDGDLSDTSSILRIMQIARPDEVYNLAAQSHVQVSFDVPEYSGDVDALGVVRILEAIRILGMEKTCRFYQASTSELYGKVEEVPQRETTPFHPYSPYAIAKQYAFWMVKEYREAYGMFAVNGILFNHESERRGENFVTRKITRAAARIACGLQDKLQLGNMDSKRDWGYAKDYVECMWLMLQHDVPEDFVIATGVQHTVREFTTLAFAHDGIQLRWEGTGMDEKGIDIATGRVLVEVNKAWFRPTDVDNLWGDPTKARTVLKWNPLKTSYEQLCQIMAEYDLQLAKKEAAGAK